MGKILKQGASQASPKRNDWMETANVNPAKQLSTTDFPNPAKSAGFLPVFLNDFNPEPQSEVLPVWPAKLPTQLSCIPVLENSQIKGNLSR
jgi:hypothetical protein